MSLDEQKQTNLTTIIFVSHCVSYYLKQIVYVCGSCCGFRGGLAEVSAHSAQCPAHLGTSTPPPVHTITGMNILIRSNCILIWDTSQLTIPRVIPCDAHSLSPEFRMLIVSVGVSLETNDICASMKLYFFSKRNVPCHSCS